MLAFTRRDVEQGIRTLQATHAKYLGFKGHTEDAVGAVAGQVLSGTAAFGYGVAEGMFGPIKVGPVHADVGAALLLHGIAFFGYAGRHQGAAHSIAQGLADGFLARTGMGVGTTMALRRGAAQRPAVSSGVAAPQVGGAPPPHSPRTLTLAELTSIVEQAR